MQKRFLWAGLIAALTVTVVGSSAAMTGKVGQSGKTQAKVLRMSLGAEPPSRDPGLATADQARQAAGSEGGSRCCIELDGQGCDSHAEPAPKRSLDERPAREGCRLRLFMAPDDLA